MEIIYDALLLELLNNKTVTIKIFILPATLSPFDILYEIYQMHIFSKILPQFTLGLIPVVTVL